MDDQTQKMARTGLRQALIGIGVPINSANRYLDGKRLPRGERAILIEDQIGVPLRAWVDKTFLAVYWKKVTGK